MRKIAKTARGRKVVSARPKPPPKPFALPGLAPVGTRYKTNSGVRLRVYVPSKPPPRTAPPKRAPIKAPVRPVRARGGAAVKATIPVHAKTPARASRSLTDATPAAKARRPAPVRKPKAAPQILPPADVMPEMTDEDLVGQALAPLYLENDQALQQEQRLEAQRTALIQSLTGELMGKLGGIAPQVQQDYQGFIGMNTALAEQGRQALAAASTNPQMQADLSAIGAPEEQKQQVATQAQNVFQGGAAALFGQQGVVPGGELASHGAAATAFSRNLPAIAGLQGAQTLREFLAAASEARRGIFDQRAQITAKGPSILSDIQNSRASQTAKDRALELEELALGLRTRGQMFNERTTTTKLKQSQARLNISALQADRSWKAQLKRLEISSAAERRKASELELKARRGGYTSTQLAKMKGTAYTIADQAFHGFTETNSKGEVVATHRALTYGEAIREMLKEGIPLRLATPALNFYYKPNQRKAAKPQSLFGALP